MPTIFFHVGWLASLATTRAKTWVKKAAPRFARSSEPGDRPGPDGPLGRPDAHNNNRHYQSKAEQSAVARTVAPSWRDDTVRGMNERNK